MPGEQQSRRGTGTCKCTVTQFGPVAGLGTMRSIRSKPAWVPRGGFSAGTARRQGRGFRVSVAGSAGRGRRLCVSASRRTSAHLDSGSTDTRTGVV
ncbi:hypothetical protein VTO42DRAFT_8082 [Malbranchea cinnamomea]